ncbi:hypothetical protein CR513_39688, partial [Mucuna pruriens]
MSWFKKEVVEMTRREEDERQKGICDDYNFILNFEFNPSYYNPIFKWRVVSELSGLKGVLLARMMEGNTNRMFKEDTSLSDHLNEFQGIIVICQEWASIPNGVVTLQMVKGNILNKEMRRKAQGSLSQSKVLVTENRRRCQKKKREKSRSKSKSRYKNVEYHYCHKTGHIQKHCFLWKKENKGKNDKSKEKDDDNDDDHVTTATGDDLIILRLILYPMRACGLLISVLHCMLHQGKSSLHLTPQMGNDGVTKVIDVGDVCLQINTRMQLWLRGVKHAPDVCFNLIFVHMLDDGGYDNHFGHGKWKLTKGNLVVARGEKISKLYWTKALVAKDSVNVMDMEASLWHRRLSHISEKGLTCLAKKGMLPRLKNVEFEKCSHCITGKQTRVSFKKHPPLRKSELLELVHSDVCGPLKVKSFSSALYFVTFIDDCSRKLWAYVLKTKDQALEKFKRFQALVERQSGKKVKCIHSNNGGEYCGPFDGIRHEKTPPKTPQLNGLAERMNKTLIERVRCMLSKARLPKHFWGEALYTIVHVINLIPTVALNTEVSDKIWFGKDVKYDHLRVFSCKAFVHVPKDERSKLDTKTRQCIFIGYGHDEYGYRMYDLIEKKLVRSRDVQFVEDQTIEDIDKLGDGFDVPLDDDAEEEQEMSQDENPGDALKPPPGQLRRSNRQRQSSTRYTSDEYVTLTHGEEPECYKESMKSEERQKAWQSKLQKCFAFSTTKAELGFVQDKHWLFYDSQSADMMTKASHVTQSKKVVLIVIYHIKTRKTHSDHSLIHLVF